MINCRDLFRIAALAIGVFIGLLAAQCGMDNKPEAAGVPDSMHLRATLTSAGHELDEGSFSLNERKTTITTADPELRAWLDAHRKQRVVITFYEWRKVAPEVRR